MFSAKDSLYNLRIARKRDNSSRTSCGLPNDELRNMVQKRRRTDSSYVMPTQVTRLCPPGETKPGNKSVQFDLTKNTHFDNCLYVEDIQQGWLSSEESQHIKNELRICLLALQHGVIDQNTVCTRGLEASLDPAVAKEKRKNRISFINRILQQQNLLKTMMGRVNDQILGKLSTILSVADKVQAMKYGAQDADEAIRIHTIPNLSDADKRKIDIDFASKDITVASIFKDEFATQMVKSDIR